MCPRFRYLAMLLFCLCLLLFSIKGALASCTSPANPIEAENCLTGNPSTDWEVSGAGNPSIQGFATDISVNRGDTVFFKVDTNATNYYLDIYRMGYYGGRGARKVAANVQPSATLPQNQPDCLTQPSTGLIDCGNWAVSASWTVPVNATSGIYFAKVIRTDNGGASHMVFVVRDDSSTSALLFQTSDTTWQAYNQYGGNSLYTGSPAGRAYKVSYNRPFNTRSVDNGQDWVFNAEYPMVRWLEANGYDVSYFTGVDSDRYGNLIDDHRVFLSVGHDEYWSGAQRTNVELARNAGVHLAFFSGNEVFWKTRWENSIDGSNTPYRTLVCYKETHANAKIDPLQNVWTGTWRDPRFSPPADGNEPENALTGTIFMVNAGATTSVRVPAADGKMRFWRNTSIATLAPNTTATLPFGTLGYEWDSDLDNGFRPAGLIRLSTTTVPNAPILLDYGSTFGSGTATHSLTLYRHHSGALVFGAGTVQWSWGLDSNHDLGSAAPDVRMQQATVNLFADMGVQPATLQSGLSLASASTDTAAPTSVITSPQAGSNVPPGSSVIISGTATDTDGGGVGGVEVSVDGGTTWHPATGRASWSYTWSTGASGVVTLKSRAADDSGNLETPGSGVNVTVGSGTPSPCTGQSLWAASAVPITAADPDTSAVELGVKFRADVAGSICGLRFYKSSANTGTHVGRLWTNSGQLLAQGTFTNETTSGWQQVNFANPVTITANSVYVASYHAPNGHYAADEGSFTTVGVDNAPLHALRDGVSGGNGVYMYGAGGVFPTDTFQGTNYWVDVVFTASSSTDTTPPTVPGNPSATAVSASQISLAWTASTDNVGVTGYQVERCQGAGCTTFALRTTVPQTSFTDSGLTAGGTYRYRVRATDAAGNVSGYSNIATATTPVSDTTSPTVSSVSPINGATSVATSTTVTVTFSEAMNATTINTNTFELRNAANTVAATVSASGNTATLTPSSPLANGTTYSALVRGGSSGVKDLAGNPLSTDYPWTFTTVAATPGTCTGQSLWAASAVPITAADPDTSAVELGVKFRADVAGSICGLRFYKSSANTGTHVGRLWTNSGQLLAQGTFTNETTSGWQQVNFANPVTITANSVYVASYHAPNGHYAADEGSFTTVGVDNAPLHALRDGVSGGNGVYMYGAGGVFPTDTFQGTNYWVDVVFTASSSTDTTPPGQPAGLIATATTSGVTLAWSANTETDLAGYYVSRRGGGAGTFTRLNATVLTSPGFEDTLAPSGTSDYTVTAVDTSGNESAQTTPVSVTMTLANRLQNPGFELDTNNNTAPDTWSSNTRFTRSNAVARSGTYSGRHFAPNNANYTINQTVSSLTADTTYTFAGWVNIPSTSDTFTFSIQVRWRNASNQTLRTDTVKNYTASTAGWNKATASLVAPSGTANALLILSINSLNATIYNDDFAFR